ncbi:MAG: TIM barrel protein [Halieaceae bacterium]|nr:TIM barrel protein [Halieaceae bacterium]
MHDRLSINNICFLDSSLEQQAEYWKQLGPQRISLVGPHLEAEGVAAARAALASGNYQIETIIHPFSPALPLTADEPGWRVPRARLATQIDVARQLGAQSIYMTTGGRGEMSWEQAADAFAEAIEPCLEPAEAAGIELMIENAPLQYADMHMAHSLRDTVRLAKLAGIGVCIDLFSCWADAELENVFLNALPLCHLVQVSDYVFGDRNLPARAVPGDGGMPLKRILGFLLESGYSGVFDLELLGPRIDAEGQLSAVERGANVIDKLLHSLGA